MQGAPDSLKGFGSKIHGQDEVGKLWAAYADRECELVTQGIMRSAKEKFTQPVCLDGVGQGKSALVDNGLSLLNKHCKNKDIVKSLRDENHPLSIHITFNSETKLDHKLERDADLAIYIRGVRCRKLLVLTPKGSLGPVERLSRRQTPVSSQQQNKKTRHVALPYFNNT